MATVLDGLSEFQEEASDIKPPSCVESATTVKEKLLNYMQIQENALLQIILPLPEEQKMENHLERQADAEEAQTIFMDEFNAFQEIVRAFKEEE